MLNLFVSLLRLIVFIKIYKLTIKVLTTSNFQWQQHEGNIYINIKSVTKVVPLLQLILLSITEYKHYASCYIKCIWISRKHLTVTAVGHLQYFKQASIPGKFFCLRSSPQCWHQSSSSTLSKSAWYTFVKPKTLINYSPGADSAKEGRTWYFTNHPPRQAIQDDARPKNQGLACLIFLSILDLCWNSKTSISV